MKMSESLEDYLEAILILKKNKEELKSISISKLLGVSKPAVNKALKELEELKLVVKPNYGDITLTEEGLKEAKRIYHRHTTIKDFLINLGVNEKDAEIDCCKIEHIISKNTFESIEKFNKSKK